MDFSDSKLSSKYRLPLFAAFLCLATPLSATPPQNITISESLVGVTDEQIFLLRTIEDNLGTYDQSATVILRVSVDLATGEDAEVWPMRSLIDRGLDLSIKPPARVRDHNIAGRNDLFDLLVRSGARPRSDRATASGEMARYPVTISPTDGSIIIGRTSSPPKAEMSLDERRTIINKRLANTWAALAGMNSNVVPSTNSPDEIARHCSVIGLFSEELPDGEHQNVVKLRCRHPNEKLLLETYLPVRKVQPNSGKKRIEKSL